MAEKELPIYISLQEKCKKQKVCSFKYNKNIFVLFFFLQMNKENVLFKELPEIYQNKGNRKRKKTHVHIIDINYQLSQKNIMAGN